MKYCAALLVALAFIPLGGCATIVSKTDKDVAFTSTPPGAKVTIESKKPGRYYNAVTPETVSMSKKASYFATFSLEGYHTVTYSVDRGVGKAAAGSGGGNLLLLGILAPVGMGIDAASGAAATLPDAIHADLVPIAEPAPANCGDAATWRVKLAEEKKAKREEARQAAKEREGK